MILKNLKNADEFFLKKERIRYKKRGSIPFQHHNRTRQLRWKLKRKPILKRPRVVCISLSLRCSTLQGRHPPCLRLETLCTSSAL